MFITLAANRVKPHKGVRGCQDRPGGMTWETQISESRRTVRDHWVHKTHIQEICERSNGNFSVRKVMAIFLETQYKVEVNYYYTVKEYDVEQLERSQL